MLTVDSRIGHELLGRPEGLRLLASHPFGRVAVLVNGCPMIFPVNHHVVDGDTIVFRSEEVSRLTDPRCAISMSLEVDGIDDAGQLWSVTITGAGRDIVPAERARLHELGLESSAAGHETPWIQIRPETVTGRRFGWLEW
jgi:nitroimidazol reductase NimA-like FMN-containing flavoprotein (pyridoxamine 5'-phosphate oxidase superfamily)